MSTKLLTPSNLKGIKFQLSGLDEYLAKIQKAGNDIEKACQEAVVESAKPIYDDIYKWAEKHKDTGLTLSAVRMADPTKQGSAVSVEIGIDSNVKYAAWHAVFVEYGTPTNDADPGIRNAFYHSKGKVKKIQKQILEQRGVPIE